MQAKKNSVPVRKHQGLHYEARKVFTEPPDCLTDDDKHIVDAACISREARDVVELESHICALQEKAKGMTKHTEKWRILKNYRIAYLKQVRPPLVCMLAVHLLQLDYRLTAWSQSLVRFQDHD